MEPSAIRLFESLPHATRLRIVLILAAEQELCVCKQAHALDEIRPKD